MSDTGHSDEKGVNDEMYPKFTKFRDERLKNPAIRAAYEEAKARRDAEIDQKENAMKAGDGQKIDVPRLLAAADRAQRDLCALAVDQTFDVDQQLQNASLIIEALSDLVRRDLGAPPVIPPDLG